MNWYKIAKKEECKGWIAVRLSSQPANKIKKWGRDNIPDNILCDNDGKTRETDVHITIVFGVCDNSIEAVKDIVKEYKSIKVSLDKVGYFKSSPDFDVVIVKIISEDLKRLHEKLVRQLDIKETFPIYKPHSCIAYIEKGEGAQFAGDTFIDGTKLTFKEVVFVNNKNEETIIKL